MRYWIISELFYPEEVSTGYVMTKIAEKLNETVDVGVICGPFGYQSDVFKASYNLDSGILIRRTKLPKFNKNNIFFRIIGSFLLSFGIAFKILIYVKRRDKVILVTNPPTLLLMLAILKRIKRFRYTIIVHDVFPENAFTGGIIKRGSFVGDLLLTVFSKAYNCANSLIVVGEDMRDLFLNKIDNQIPIKVITNWADHKEIFPVVPQNLSEYYSIELEKQVVLQFAGNIGRVQGLDLFFDSLTRLKNKSFSLILIGSGAQKPILESIKARFCLNNIFFLQPKPRSQQQEFLNACHIGLVTLTSGMYGLGVPSKVYNILSAGKPVLYVGDSNAEIYRYVRDYNVGWAFTWDELDKLSLFLESINMNILEEIKLKGLNARKLVENKFTKDQILEQYKDTIIND